METIQITLPDGATREVPRGTTAARNRAPNFAAPREGSAGRARRWRAGGSLAPARSRRQASPSSPRKDPDALQVFRHSAAHLLAAAVLELFPDVKLGIGPPIDNGFFYEFRARTSRSRRKTSRKSKPKMHELAAQDIPNERKLLPKPEALELYRKCNQEFKCELVEEKAIEPMVSFYTTGKFIDFCRGPHIPSTGRIKAFKLMNVSGAYWKGQEGNPQMQRIYGACFYTTEGTRRISAQAGRSQAARPSQLGPGTRPFQHSGRGRAGPDFLASEGRPDPQNDGRLAARRIAAPRLRSGLHAAHHAPGFVEDQRPRRISIAKTCSAPIEVEKDDYQLKPMNCPGPHSDLQIAAAQLPRTAGAPCRARHRLSLRALRRAARPAARARLHAGRRAHFLHAGADRIRDRRRASILRSP